MTTEENPPVSPLAKGDQILRRLPKKCVWTIMSLFPFFMNLIVGRLENYKMKALVALFSLNVLVSACGGAFQARSAVALGRQELFRAQNQDALESFEVAARADPGYSFGVDRPEGVFSYLGRAQYLNGQYAQARQSLERDLARDPNNSRRACIWA